MALSTYNESHRPIRTPEAWVERRLEETSPELSSEVLAQAEEELAALPTPDAICLTKGIDISYYPNGLAGIANKAGASETSILDSVVADLSNGVAVQLTSWTTKDGQNKVCLLGVRWRVVIRPQTAEQSHRTVSVLESLQQQNVPTRRPAFRPQWVRFHPIWDEVYCNAEDLNAAYQACLKELREADDKNRQFESMRARRKNALRQVRRELGEGTPDAVVQNRSLLHAIVRKQYSALRVMMDLLRLRSDCEKHSFQAVVTASSTEENRSNDDEGEGKTDSPNLCIQASSQATRDALEEGSLIEIRRANQERPVRARVLSLASQSGIVLAEVDLSADEFQNGTDVQIEVVSRFGLWAHQRAVQDFLGEQVQGYWPDLATALCRPADLTIPPTPPTPNYFCDLEDAGPPLNDRQRAAVAGALATPHVFCIQGPPGTGKTTVICELVQQLIARGERILLAAPTHVAVDEVLRRIGTRESVRALRLSWDDARIAENVRRFAPSRIFEPFLERAQQRDSGSADRWQHEQEDIQAAMQVLEKLQQCQSETADAAQERVSADHRKQKAKSQLASEGPSLQETQNRLAGEIQTTETAIDRLRRELDEVKATLEVESRKAGWGSHVLSWFNFGALGQIRRRRNNVSRQLQRQEGRLGTLRRQEATAKERFKAIGEEASAATRSLAGATKRLKNSVSFENEAEEACSEHAMLRDRELEPESVAGHLAELATRRLRLDQYRLLRRRFDEIVVEVTDGGEDLENLRRDLLAVTNLFCCTTTGIAGSQELKGVLVDTLIIDEASRVTDSEFLIGAVRAKRWILVGDEQQLPPYVEQNDEHFIHALSALDQSERRDVPLDAAVDELGDLWEEDEELHRFRRQSVAEVATVLRDTSQWTNMYREAFREGINYLGREVENPTRELLRAMRENMVRSLFERMVVSCPDSLRLRLVEQRRMIEPLARIVSEPIYGGDYCTPSETVMSQCGLSPLSTPTFPTPVTFLDTSALGIKARDESIRNGFVNRTEARWVVEACEVLDRELGQAGAGIVTVSILAFYKAQARLIREQLLGHRPGRSRFRCLRFLVIDAIDRIQGQESDVVFLSFCRTAGKAVSPRFGQWLQDLRRVNVACTRARRALILVGQKELLGKLCSSDRAIQFYRHLNSLFETHPETMRVVRQFGGAGTWRT